MRRLLVNDDDQRVHTMANLFRQVRAGCDDLDLWDWKPVSDSDVRLARRFVELLDDGRTAGAPYARRRERPTTMNSPAVTALVDQAQAAADHANATFDQLRRQHDMTAIPHLTGAAAAVIDRLAKLAQSGQVTLCPHLNPRAPQLMFWAAWRPGRIRCIPCAQAVDRAIQGTREDRRCDHCRKVRRTLHAHAGQISAVVVPALLYAQGPIAVNFGLCDACYATTEPHRRSAS